MTDDMVKLRQHLTAQASQEPYCCLVLGGADTGKTMLVNNLACASAAGKKVAVIDADIGQSHIGPPTTVGWALADPAVFEMSALPVREIYFVGDVAPTGRLLQLTAAINLASRQALQQAQLVIIDTGGFINDPAARALWWQVHRIIVPQVVVAVQRHDELEPILKGLAQITPNLFRLGCSPQVRSKSAHRRRQFRRRRFADYFRHRQDYMLDLADVSLQPARLRGSADPDNFSNRLVALRDRRGRDRALGIIVAYHKQNNMLVITSPPITIEEIRCVVMGDVQIDLSTYFNA